MSKSLDKNNYYIHAGKKKQGNLPMQLHILNGYHKKINNNSDICLKTKEIYSVFGFQQGQYLGQNWKNNCWPKKKEEKKEGMQSVISNSQKYSSKQQIKKRMNQKWNLLGQKVMKALLILII